MSRIPYGTRPAWANQSCITDPKRVQGLSIFESNATSLKPSPAQKLQSAATAEFLFSTPMGSVLALGGIDGMSLYACLIKLIMDRIIRARFWCELNRHREPKNRLRNDCG